MLRQREKIEDSLFIVEHPPVYTLGRSSDERRHLLVEHEANPSSIMGIPVVRTNRGGGVMFHNPGQVVAYPVIKLRIGTTGIRRFLWLIEEAIIQSLAVFDVKGYRQPDIHPGVWTDSGKIGFIGIAISRGVVFHGFAVNIANDLIPFSYIATCGILDCRVSSLQQMTSVAVTTCEFAKILISRFLDVMDETYYGKNACI